jgi:hypothetical protein
LRSAIGDERFKKLSAECTHLESIPQQLEHLRQEAQIVYQRFTAFEPLGNLETWSSICGNAWWFDETYIGYKIDAIRTYFKAAEEYAKLPRARGVGHLIESWVKDRGIDSMYAAARSEFSTILDNTR